MQFSMPNIYPNGSPLYWMFEKSGRLKEAIFGYLYCPQLQEMSESDIIIVKQYMLHWVKCPNWHFIDALEYANAIIAVESIEGKNSIKRALNILRKYGIDPI